jgi:hypothetical protein
MSRGATIARGVDCPGKSAVGDSKGRKMAEKRDDLGGGNTHGDGVEPPGSSGGGQSQEPGTNPYADDRVNAHGSAAWGGGSHSDNPFEPSASPGMSAQQSPQLGLGYWGPMIGLFAGLMILGMIGGFASILFLGCMYVIAVFHGVTYQSRLFARANVGELHQRLPDAAVFLVSCLVGFLSPIAAGVAFLSVCSVSYAALQNPGPGYEVFFLFSLVLAAAVAMTLGIVLFRLFLPRKPK